MRAMVFSPGEARLASVARMLPLMLAPVEEPMMGERPFRTASPASVGTARPEPQLPLTSRDPDLLLLQIELSHERRHLLVLKVFLVVGQELRARRLDGGQPQGEPCG